MRLSTKRATSDVLTIWSTLCRRDIKTSALIPQTVTCTIHSFGIIWIRYIWGVGGELIYSSLSLACWSDWLYVDVYQSIEFHNQLWRISPQQTNNCQSKYCFPISSLTRAWFSWSYQSHYSVRHSMPSPPKDLGFRRQMTTIRQVPEDDALKEGFQTVERRGCRSQQNHQPALLHLFCPGGWLKSDKSTSSIYLYRGNSRRFKKELMLSLMDEWFREGVAVVVRTLQPESL